MSLAATLLRVTIGAPPHTGLGLKEALMYAKTRHVALVVMATALARTGTEARGAEAAITPDRAGRPSSPVFVSRIGRRPA